MPLAALAPMETLVQDLRYAFRAFVKAPGFTAIVLITIALGAGANATVFSFVSALLLRPSPGVADPSTLIAIYTSDFSSGPYGTSSYPDYLSLKAEADAFSSMAAYQEGAVALIRVMDTVERVRGTAVSAEFFEVLGVRAAEGRLLGAADMAPGAPPAAVIGYDLSKRAFGLENSALGRTLVINGRHHTVIGVAPPKFDGLHLGPAFELWTPLVPETGDEARGNRSLSIVGRLRDGVSLTQARTQLDAIATRLGAAYPATNRGTLGHPDQARPMRAVRDTRMHPAFRDEVSMISAILMAAVALVLLIACANVAALLLSRAAARARELAVRLALGATHRRIVRQMLTESLVLGLGGGALGLLVALWTADALPSFFPAEQARLLDARVDGHVMLFTAVVSLVSSALFGIAPALQALRASAIATLRGDSGRVTDGRSGVRVRNALVTAQVAIASVLLVSAVLLTRSLTNAQEADLGFGTRTGVISSIEVPGTTPPERGQAYYREVLERVRALPGVEAASMARAVPVTGTERRGFRMEGYESRPGEDTEQLVNTVERDYFATMKIRLVSGRVFDASDTASGAPVAVVNDVLAARYFRGDAVGRRMRDSSGTLLQIIGVVHAWPQPTAREPPTPVVFYPLEQRYIRRVVLVARTAADPLTLADSVRRLIASVDRDAAVFATTTLEARLAEALAADRLTTALVASCGAIALILAIVGVYGVVAYAVVRRTREIGVRIALGATPLDILRLLMGEGGRVVLMGVAGGVFAALLLTRVLASVLYGVSATDPATFTVVPAVLAVVAFLASCVPARRALRVNPVSALREE